MVYRGSAFSYGVMSLSAPCYSSTLMLTGLGSSSFFIYIVSYLFLCLSLIPDLYLLGYSKLPKVYYKGFSYTNSNFYNYPLTKIYIIINSLIDYLILLILDRLLLSETINKLLKKFITIR